MKIQIKCKIIKVKKKMKKRNLNQIKKDYKIKILIINFYFILTIALKEKQYYK